MFIDENIQGKWEMDYNNDSFSYSEELDFAK